MGDIFLGFDPGGRDKFGCSAIRLIGDGLVEVVNAECVRDAKTAIEWANAHSAIAAAGIDTLLGWSFSGSRTCDATLRQRYPGHRNSVIEQNSLYSAMTINGAMVAANLHLRKTPLCEAHPKLLLKAYDGHSLLAPLQAGLQKLKLSSKTPKQADDKCDATVAAWAAACWYSGSWKIDLFSGDDLWFPAWKARYPWPD